MVWTFLKRFKERKRERKLRKILPFEGSRRDELLSLLTDKDFCFFLNI